MEFNLPMDWESVLDAVAHKTETTEMLGIVADWIEERMDSLSIERQDLLDLIHGLRWSRDNYVPLDDYNDVWKTKEIPQAWGLQHTFPNVDRHFLVIIDSLQDESKNVEKFRLLCTATGAFYRAGKCLRLLKERQ